MQTGLKDRSILVTGASGGIGAATVHMLAEEGADVIASGRDEEKLAALAAETGCRSLPFDLTSEESVKTALEGLDLWGVVNCGGWGGEIATPMETDISVFRHGRRHQRSRDAPGDEVRRAEHGPAWKGRSHRQRLVPGLARRARGPHFLCLVEGCG